MNLEKLITFAKGKLTVSSILAYLVSNEFASVPAVFNEGIGNGTNVLEVVAVAGAIWGIIRKTFTQYKKA